MRPLHSPKMAIIGPRNWWYRTVLRIIWQLLIACRTLPMMLSSDGLMKSAVFLLGCLLLCSLSHTVWCSAQAQQLTFMLSEQIVIGDDEDAPEEYLFTRPEIVRTDSRGFVYVSDQRRADVRVFDGTGQYVTTIGRRGDGPGEMNEVFGMHVDARDRLIVADRNNQRFTVFAEFGKSVETKAFPDDAWGAPFPILSLGDDLITKYVRIYDDSEGRLPYGRDTKTLHLYDSSLNHRDTFADLEALFDLSVPFEMEDSDGADALKMATNGLNSIVLVPQVYSGIVYRYTHAAGNWHLETWKGGPVPKKSYMAVSEADRESNPELRGSSIVTAGPSGVFYGRIFNWSLGIFLLSTGELVHFTKQTPLRGSLDIRRSCLMQPGICRATVPFGSMIPR